MNRWISSLFVSMVVVACSRPAQSKADAGLPPAMPPPAAASVVPPASTAPRSFDEAVKAAGLVPIELKEIARVPSFRAPAPKPGQIAVGYTVGWNGGPPRFAHKPDGTIVQLVDRPTVVVDRHVPGCPSFAGGGADLVTGVFELPAGATWGGEVPVVWEKHIEVVDLTAAAACPPPAMD